MSAKLELFYKKNNIPEILIKKKLEMFERHKDIEEEFIYWIEQGEYKQPGSIVEGYSAKKLAETSKFLNGEGAFIMLIELRENSQKALEKIKKGFEMK